MPSFWRIVNRVLQNANIIIEVLDARMVRESRNLELEGKVRSLGKTLLYVITKSDLVQNAALLDSWKEELKPCVFISSKDKLGTTILKKEILRISRGENVVVGVVGYPNVGKSSLINALAGRSAARTSASSGFTRGLQRIKVDNKIMLLDTPGVLSNFEKDEAKLGKICAVDYAKIKDPEKAVFNIINENKELILSFYHVEKGDAEEILERIAIKYKKMSSGGKPNLDSAARMVLKDWQCGKIKV